jgi:hypothetical protein
MNFTLRIFDAHTCTEELIPADTVQVFSPNHTDKRFPPDGGILYSLNGKEDFILDGVIYVMNAQGKTVAKYKF